MMAHKETGSLPQVEYSGTVEHGTCGAMKRKEDFSNHKT
jgi:hypothetical protein